MFPKNIQIETTTICPAKCVMCPQKHVSRPKFMADELINKIIKECSGKDVTIIPHQMGDALADNRIIDILRKCKKNGLKILMSTSGILLNKKMAQELIAAGADTINISLDSLDKKTYEKIRNISFDTVMKNIEGLLSLKRPNTKIWVSAVDMFFNKKTRKEFIDYWKGKVDNVQICPYVRYPKARRFGLPEKKPNLAGSCRRLETDMVILSSGEAAKCCIDFDGATSFGNVNNESLRDIWNGAKRKGFIEKVRITKRKGLYPCSICVI